jgi:hypothetical protein
VKWTEALVVERLRAHYTRLDAKYGQTGTHALLTQVPAAGRIIDVLVMTSDPVERYAIEVKVTRADYRAETDAKRLASWQLAHRCLYAAPVGLIDPATLPRGWGLYEVTEDGAARLYRHGEWHEPVIGNDAVTEMALRRCAAAEDAIRLGETEPAEVARLRWEVDRYAGLVQSAQDSRATYRRQAVAACSELLAVQGMQECGDCEQPVTWLRAQMEWTHPDPQAHKDCAKTRRERDRRRRERETGSQYLWGKEGSVEPKALRDAIGEAS